MWNQIILILKNERKKKKKSMYFCMMYILSVAKWANSNCFGNFMWQTQHSKHQGWCPKVWQTCRMMSFNWNFRPGQTFGNCCSHVDIAPWFLLSNSRGSCKNHGTMFTFLATSWATILKSLFVGGWSEIPIGCSPFCWLPALGHLLWCYEWCVCPMNFSGQFKLAHARLCAAVFLTQKKEKNIFSNHRK